jgi:prefoldin subunit 5
MATNYEQIQANLAKCNITLWEPDDLRSIQLSPCRMQCLENELAIVSAKITEAADAIQDIENVATQSGGADDVTFVNATLSDQNIVWDMSPTASGAIRFSVNQQSRFFTDYLIPNVSTLLVPITEDDGSGGTVDRNSEAIRTDRIAALQKPENVIETTITALAAFISVVQAKRTQLEAEYA